jgi:hypothetical protein
MFRSWHFPPAPAVASLQDDTLADKLVRFILVALPRGP